MMILKIFIILCCRYIYSDEFNVDTIYRAFDLYFAAKKYMITSLIEICVKYMISKLEPKNVCRVYELAKFFDQFDLKNECIKVLFFFKFSL